MKRVIKVLFMLFICMLLVAIFVININEIYYGIDARNNIEVKVSTELLHIDDNVIKNTDNEHYLFYNYAFPSDESNQYECYICLVEVTNNSNCQCVSNVYFKQKETNGIIIQSRIDVFNAYTILPHSKEVIPIALQIKKQVKEKAIKNILDEIPKRINLDLTKSVNNIDELDYSCSVSKRFFETKEDFSKRNITFPLIY